MSLGVPNAFLVCRHAVRQCGPDVPSRADDRQDDPATVWWDAGRVEHLHGFLPGRLAGRLWVRSFSDQVVGTAAPGGFARALVALAGAVSTDWDCQGLDA